MINDRGKPTFVLLSIEEYRRLTGSGEDLLTQLIMDDDLDIDFEPIEIGLKVPEL